MQGTHLAKPTFKVAAATPLLLLIPLVAMQYTAEVSWDLGDFFAAAALLFTAGMACAVGTRCVRTTKQRILVGLVVFAVLGTVWAELAVGILR